MNRPTRGYGVFETFLAKQRYHKARSLIPPLLRKGGILDIGCGSMPYLLTRETFREKHALDQLPPPSKCPPDISWHTHNLNQTPQLPFADGKFTCITMLAVLEHLEPDIIVPVLADCRRCLAPDGQVVMTTPAAHADKLLHFLAALHMVSPEEIHEHKMAFTPAILRVHLVQAGFPTGRICVGRFELGLNLWAVATC
ncbi:MAG: class I SAM-dependent methyltransferase [bacterium]